LEYGVLNKILKSLGWQPDIRSYIERSLNAAYHSVVYVDPVDRSHGPIGPFAAPVDGSRGRIGSLVDNRLPIFLAQPWSEQPPLVLVDGFPPTYPQTRAKMPGNVPHGLETPHLLIAGARAGAVVELFGFANGAFSKLDQLALPDPVIETGFLSQLDRAAFLSRQPGAVAITCWDGAHNPIGRAKVLYDVVSRKRPAIIISYLSKNFGGTIWQPIMNESCEILTIPWERRHVCEKAIRRSGIRFDTVWICKPRLPSFMLGALVAAPDARMILDFDDNEEEFSLSPSAETTFYGKLTINLARKLIDALPARTAASRSLQEAFGGRLMRHARDPYEGATALAPKTPGVPVKIGFIGTVRHHKRILEAASAIARYSQSRGRPVQFHVYGDVSPKSLAMDLSKLGVVLKSNIPMHTLNAELARFDVVLTGFPGQDPRDHEINRFQISSKIGDALAVGRPVLVPDCPSTSDLASIEGVFLFNTTNFEARLQEATNFQGKIALPEPFTIDGAYSNFTAAEADASAGSGAAGVRALLPDGSFGDRVQPALRPTLLLIWKQHDAGLFGRRVDQIARSYRRQHPDHDVVILELLSPSMLKHFDRESTAFHAEWHHVFDMADQKRTGLTDSDGVRMLQLQWTVADHLSQAMEHFLLTHGFLPQNTVVVLFPIISEIDAILPPLKAYWRIADIVDNQICRSDQNTPLTYVRQYLMLTGSSDAIVFNSAANRDYFQQNRFLPDGVPMHVIPNWYQLPAGFQKSQSAPYRTTEARQIAYSGNMRNRFNFDLVVRLSQRVSDVTIHLIGSLPVQDAAAMRALKMPNVVYHGPKPERETLELLSLMDLAIVPHRLDTVSAYMDPLKVEMYESIGLRTVTTDMPGIESTELITVATSEDDFIELVVAQLAASPDIVPVIRSQDSSDTYVRLISQFMDQFVMEKIE
jgi:glycosyltransferase involved in cell wall biosynthesis